MAKAIRTSKSKTDANNSPVQSLMRGLMLLENISENKLGVSLTDLALQVGLPNSTVHRLLTTLEQRGFITQRGETGLWMIGSKAFLVGSAFFRSRDLITITHPVMQKLMNDSGETVNLAVLDRSNWKAILIGQVQCEKLMRMVATLGGGLPLHASGSGKIFLSSFSEKEIKEIITYTGLQRFTDQTIDTYEDLAKEMKNIRQQGYALDYEEHAAGLKCVAAPIYDEFNKVIASISISGPTTRMSDEEMLKFSVLVTQAAKNVNQLFSGHFDL